MTGIAILCFCQAGLYTLVLVSFLRKIQRNEPHTQPPRNVEIAAAVLVTIMSLGLIGTLIFAGQTIWNVSH